MAWDFFEWFRRRRRSSFRDIFEEMEEMMRELEETIEREFKEFVERVPRDLVRERRLPDGSTVREWGPFVYGYSMIIGPDGKPIIREFGNVRPSRTPLGRPMIDVREEREPLVDVFPTDGEIRVVAELPGVEKDDIKLYGTEDSLTISVDTPQRKYYKEVQLPAKVDPKRAKTSYKNGVLEVTLPKVEEEKKPKGEPIKVE